MFWTSHVQRILRAGLLSTAATVILAPSAAASPGHLDPTFGRDGILSTQFGNRNDLAVGIARCE